jgi:hypothetical protein
MAKRWQLRTWTKGTGATVEPEGAQDGPRGRARPGGLSRPLPTRPFAGAPRSRRQQTLPDHRVSGGARHRHALGYLDEATVERLERLESHLRGD